MLCGIMYDINTFSTTSRIQLQGDYGAFGSLLCGEKIQKIFTFRIPYYVGPLNGIRKKGEKSNWAVRKEGKIYPWNFDEMVDLEASAEQFIRRMTNKCTYLPSEDVLPKYSLLYSKYEVLNELNNLRLDGEKISVEQKQKIYEEVFQKSRKVTQKKLKKKAE